MARVIFNDANRGFPAAANQGIRAATGSQILLINNDTLATTGWLRHMLRAMHSDPRIGLELRLWCDSFSAARNESFRHARGQWIFWMDSDDTIDVENGLAMRRLALRDDPGFMAYTMKVYCPGRGEDGQAEVTAVDQVKLVRNLPEIRWDRRIHEQLIPSIRRVGGAIAMT